MKGHDLGVAGEDLAARYLADKGFAILCRNWRYGKLELDIVCEDRDCIVFVEVKTRGGHNFGGAAGAINSKKMRNLAIAAQAWLKASGRWENSCRFDVICLTCAGGDFALEHYADAFNLTQALDYSHTSR